MQACKRSLTVHNIPNLRTVVTSWRYCSRVKWRIDYLNDHSHRSEALRHIEASREIFSTFCGLIISTFKQCKVGKILAGFQGRWFTDFLQSSRYFSLTFILINSYHVECGDGRQPKILVDNFWILWSKTRMHSTPGFHAEPCYYFFCIGTSLCIFSFQS